MMLIDWRVSNFKAIGAQVNLDLRPLTVLCGANSSGKSTLIQSILLTAQTLRTLDQLDRVILNGPLTQLGTCSELKHIRNRDISIGFDFVPTEVPWDPDSKPYLQARYGSNASPVIAVSCDFSFGGQMLGPRDEVFPPVLKSKVDAIDSEEKRIGWVLLDRREEPDLILQRLRAQGIRISDAQRDFLLYGPEQVPGDWILVGEGEAQHRRCFLGQSPFHFLDRGSALLLQRGDSSPFVWVLPDEAERSPNEHWEAADPHALIRTHFVERLLYVGPIRPEARSVSPYSATSELRALHPTTADSSQLLHLRGDESGNYVLPNHAENRLINSTLIEAVDCWIKYLGIGAGVSTRDRGNVGVELSIRSASGESHDIRSVGVGAAQILPLIVVSMLAPENSTLLVEQPEVHLHPAAQSRLADLFVALAQRGIQCIVETHSEYFVNRLRYKAATYPDKTLAESIGLYFVEKVQGEARFRHIPMDEYGAMEEWPTGFFDEGLLQSEQILRAGLEKRWRDTPDETDGST